MIRQLSFGAVALTMFSGWGEIYAQDQGLYIGGSLGQSRANNVGDCSDVFDIVNSCSVKTKDTGWRLFAGYQINQNAAIEGSYVDLGTFTISGSGRIAGTPVFGNASGSDKANGFSLDAVGTLPVNAPVGLVGRIGVFAWTLDASATASGGGISASASDKPKGVSLDFGVGVKYDFDRDIGIRGEFERFTNIGNDTTGKSDIDLISASILYRFR